MLIRFFVDRLLIETSKIENSVIALQEKTEEAAALAAQIEQLRVDHAISLETRHSEHLAAVEELTAKVAAAEELAKVEAARSKALAKQLDDAAHANSAAVADYEAKLAVANAPKKGTVKGREEGLQRALDTAIEAKMKLKADLEEVTRNAEQLQVKLNHLSGASERCEVLEQRALAAEARVSEYVETSSLNMHIC